MLLLCYHYYFVCLLSFCRSHFTATILPSIFYCSSLYRLHSTVLTLCTYGRKGWCCFFLLWTPYISTILLSFSAVGCRFSFPSCCFVCFRSVAIFVQFLLRSLLHPLACAGLPILSPFTEYIFVICVISKQSFLYLYFHIT